MRRIDNLQEVLENHKHWLDKDCDGWENMRADLSDVCLTNANLRYAELRFANLSGAYISGVDLSYADLSYADLSDAYLHNANLSGANIRYTNLSRVRYNTETAFFALTCPEEGSFIAWKSCRENMIVKLRVTDDAQRSSATTRKCRCSKAEVIQIEDVNGNVLPDDTVAYSMCDKKFTYKKGDIVEVSNFDTDRWNECSTGIHFFMTRQEAVMY